ncbi:hypothetical protein AAFO92_22365 [Roseovarius sp. CAU 1744]|uniref:hypothetical protein n=1 Tax=Roseovarius sp. CAU 1744 TaxID=3140368 RepID=UPI00325AF95F
MTSYKDLLVLLNDLKNYADKNNFPEAEKLISRARQAMDKDFGSSFRPVRRPQKTSGNRAMQ